MIPALLETALRALLLALLVGGGLALLRVKNVLAQKLAWGLVLLAAVSMPLAMHWPLGLSVALPVFLHRTEPLQPAANLAPAPYVAPHQTTAAMPLQLSQPAAAVNLADEKPQPPLVMQDPAVSPVANASAWWTRPATAIWMLYFAVLAALLVRLMVGLFAAFRLWRRAQPVMLAQLPLRPSDELDGLRLRKSAAVHSPVTIAGGVLLPANFNVWDEEKLRIVLAHEYSHVRQGDFYLQLIARLHASVFWFSPLGWWLKRKLSDLSETISDRAGLRIAADGPAYAQVLLEFAAMPRTTFTGVAMARTSNLSRRIERLLNDANFRQAFTGGPIRALAASLLVLVAMLAATTAVRVQAAGQDQGQSQQTVVTTTTQSTEQDATSTANAPEKTVVIVRSGKEDEERSPEGSQKEEMRVTLQADEKAPKGKAYSFSFMQDQDGESRAFVANHGGKVVFSGNWNKARQEELEKAQKTAHGSFLWFTHNGKSYIVDDPAVTAEIEAMYASNLETMKIMGNVEPMKKMVIDIDPPKIVISTDFSKKMDEVNQAMEKLQVKLGNSSMLELKDLQQKLADLQKQISDMHVRKMKMQREMVIDTDAVQKMAADAERSAQVRVEVQDRGKIDEQLKSIIEQSLKDNKARPVE